MSSALYAGAVVHVRHRPMEHRLRYRMVQGLFELDELPGLDKRSRLFGYNRPGLVSFHDRDHGDGTGDLQAWVRGLLAEAGLDAPGPIAVLCMPRMLGFAFNPLSLFFCHDAAGGLAAILYQVNNTFGERHSYLIAVDGGAGPIRQAAAKSFHVSPFLPMSLDYAFTVVPPGEGVLVKVVASDAAGVVLDAAFSGVRRPIDDYGLARALLSYPLMTFKVVAGIHWEALKLWLKGARYHRRPAHGSPVTIGTPER